MTEWTPDQLALLADSRLRSDARLIGFAISLQETDEDGFGPPMPYDQAAELLGKASKGAVQTAMHELTVNGWVERRPGGRGRGDRFRFIGGPSGATYPRFRSALRDHLFDRWSLSDDLSALRVSVSDDLSVRRCREGVVDGVGVARAEFSTSLDPSVDKVLEDEAELFTGCRGAVRDYLAARVPKTRQVGYVRKLQMWLNGEVRAMRRDDGSQVPASDRATVLALALNDLAGSNESQMSRPVGDPANLLTKLPFSIREFYGDSGRSSRPKASGIDITDPSRYEGIT